MVKEGEIFMKWILKMWKEQINEVLVLALP